jgi:16S rRNA (guanine966-N2)-methyltransferase
MPARSSREARDRTAQAPRIIGGALRGRRLLYDGQMRTRPMKDRVREALFNLLGPLKGAHAIDLFAGTGALAFEALSRGAERATLLEQHFPTAETVRQNAAALGVTNQCEVLAADAFVWAARTSASSDLPWLVFVSPPYELFVSRRDDMLNLVSRMIDRAPAGSTFVVEADRHFDFRLLPCSEQWDVREYLPAVVGIHHHAQPHEAAILANSD